MEKTQSALALARAPAAAVIFAVLNATASQAAGDAAKGEAVFVRQCALCHTIERSGPNRFGPNLFGIVDRKAASAPGFKYSDAFKKEANWTWSADGIRSFVIAPGVVIPGNRMGVFQGVADKDADDLIAYVAEQK